MLKKILWISILFFAMQSGVFAASELLVTLNGVTSVVGTVATQNVNVDYNALGEITLSVKALDTVLRNSISGQRDIPVSNLYVRVTGDPTKYQFSGLNPVTLLNTNLGVVLVTTPLTFTIENAGYLPKGTYSVNLEFTLRTGTIVTGYQTYVTNFNLMFTIPLTQTLTNTVEPSIINVASSDVFSGSTDYIKNTTSPQLNISSNSKWKLTITTPTSVTLPNRYFYQLKSYSAGVTPTDLNVIELLPNRSYTLAKGVPTLDASGVNVLQNCVIEYSMKNKTGVFYPEGTYDLPVSYILEEDS